MGNQASFDMTHFSEEELKKLYSRYKSLDDDKSGELDINEFLRIPELAQNPLVKRVFNIFDEDGNGLVSFEEFIKGIG